MLVVTTPATDRLLLSAADIRSAAGAKDSSRDAELAALNGYISALIAGACKVVPGGNVAPTLRQEVITETLNPYDQPRAIVLSRRPVVSIASITEVDTVLILNTDYYFDAAAGIVYRGTGSCPGWWATWPLVIVYTAGWNTVPDDLKYAAIKFVQSELQRGTRDPMLRSKTIEGVSSSTWWVDPTRDTAVPVEVMDILARGGYVNNYPFM